MRLKEGWRSGAYRAVKPSASAYVLCHNLVLTGKTLLNYAIPYWRRLALVLALSLVSTALSLVIPYLSKDLFDHALLGRDFRRLEVIVALFTGITLVSFLLNVV